MYVYNYLYQLNFTLNIFNCILKIYKKLIIFKRIINIFSTLLVLIRFINELLIMYLLCPLKEYIITCFNKIETFYRLQLSYLIKEQFFPNLVINI